MRVLVTGATGFIGRHVVAHLLEKNHDVVAMGRSVSKLSDMPWSSSVRFITHDIHGPIGEFLSRCGKIDVLVHLAWQGLPDCRSGFHIEENLPANYRFLESLVASGVNHLLVTGTCLEYGMQLGRLGEDILTRPVIPYGQAKDSLRKSMQALQQGVPFTLQWLRVFYLYGAGQHPNSLLSQLDRAIKRRDNSFDMTSGEQLRDYLPVEEVARRIGLLLENPQVNGVINCCSGIPISVRSLVERRIGESGAMIRLNLGHYPYPDYEPFAFWGSSDKLEALTRSSEPA